VPAWVRPEIRGTQCRVFVDLMEITENVDQALDVAGRVLEQSRDR
jgi:hypothetical protein